MASLFIRLFLFSGEAKMLLRLIDLAIRWSCVTVQNRQTHTTPQPPTAMFISQVRAGANTVEGGGGRVWKEVSSSMLFVVQCFCFGTLYFEIRKTEEYRYLLCATLVVRAKKLCRYKLNFCFPTSKSPAVGTISARAIPL